MPEEAICTCGAKIFKSDDTGFWWHDVNDPALATSEPHNPMPRGN